jgi:hypothetical protein
MEVHIHHEDGNCNVCRKVGLLSTFDAAHLRKPKFQTELQPPKPYTNHILGRL